MANHEELVTQFIEAMNDEDFTLARSYTAYDMQFIGVLGTRNGAEAYFNDMVKMRLKYRVQKIFIGGDDVCLWYDIAMPGGVEVPSSGWYGIKDGKIQTIKVIFDPRPVLEAQKK